MAVKKKGRKRAKSYITRTYYVINKKTGRKNKVVKKYYKNQISPVLTYASGKADEQRIEEFLQTIPEMDRQDAKDLIRRARYNKVRMTEKTLRAKLAGSKKVMMVINTGENMESTLKKLHTTIEEYLDERNWKKGGIFVGGKDAKSRDYDYQFTFKYKGSVWRKVRRSAS